MVVCLYNFEKVKVDRVCKFDCLVRGGGTHGSITGDEPTDRMGRGICDYPELTRVWHEVVRL